MATERLMFLKETLKLKLIKTAFMLKWETMPEPQKTIKAEAAKLTWLPKRTFTLEFSLPWLTVKKTYEAVLNDFAKEVTLKGFRKGKAPKNLVEKNLDKSKIYEEAIRRLLPLTYELAVKQHHLLPIVSPKIEVISIKEGEDWQFKATACEKPEIRLGNYQNLVRGELAKEKIWTPEKGKAEKAKSDQLSSEKKISLATKTLLKNIIVEISDILIDNEVNRMLAQLLNEVNSLGMTINQYLQARSQTIEKIRTDFKNQAEETLKLEFILYEIIKDQKIKATPDEIEKMIQAIPDEKIRQKFNEPQEKIYISSVIAKRKAIDYLISL